MVNGATTANDDGNEPWTMNEALSSPKRAEWEKEMKTEMESLKINDVWELVELPEDRKVIGSKCVFRVKTDAGTKVETHKARLVAQGFSQTFGDDYDETFHLSPGLNQFELLLHWLLSMV